jgi:hypothetical protein
MWPFGMIVGLVVCLTPADSPEPPLANIRLSVHTLLREDIFAGVLDDDLERLARGERNIEILLKQRPADKPALLVWKAGAILYRAVRSLESNRSEDFEKKYAQVLDLLSEAKKLAPEDFGVKAATAGIYAIFADRLPEKYRSAAWSTAYDCYQFLWQKQAGAVKMLPLHLRGEVLGGLAQSAQRIGRTKEVDEYLDKILAVAADTPYALAARQWKDDPKAATRAKLTCLTCHAPGRLAARQAALDANKPQ